MMNQVKVFRFKRPTTRALVFFSLAALITIAINKTIIEVVRTNEVLQYEYSGRPRADWVNYTYLALEKRRKGLGEHGTPVILSEKEANLSAVLVEDYSYNVLVSDRISLDRSIPDTRAPACQHKLYYAELPTTSVIIIFHNEYLSVLLRTVHSVVNRSPPKLLKEVILVDDLSSKAPLGAPLESHIQRHFPEKVRILRLPVRSGLMRARMAGVQNATGDVVVIMDAHIEVNTNWLPPLLQPITDDYRTTTLGIIDYVDAETFEYRSSGPNGYRGVLNWDMTYILLPRKFERNENVEDNYSNPVMLGAFFAISRDFFWELGGYDDQLEIWGAEQFELSFKIWMCGGRMITTPCTRAGHNFKGKGPHPFMSTENGNNYIWRNMKRVAEVWLDDYKYVLYNKLPHIRAMQEGDLTRQKALRERLECKPFKWYLETVAPDVLKTFPISMPAEFASGTISSVALTGWCVDVMEGNAQIPIGVYTCHSNATYPQQSQFFSLSYFRDIRVKGEYQCWDANPEEETNGRVPIKLNLCHTLQGNQMFRYDHVNLLITSNDVTTGTDRCLDVDFGKKPLPELFMAECNDTSTTQKWEWGFVNDTLLNNWDTYGDVAAE